MDIVHGTSATSVNPNVELRNLILYLTTTFCTWLTRRILDCFCRLCAFRLLYVTTGILLRRLTSGDNLKDVSHVIIVRFSLETLSACSPSLYFADSHAHMRVCVLSGVRLCRRLRRLVNNIIRFASTMIRTKRSISAIYLSR